MKTEPDVGILFWVTKHYDALRKFFIDLGLNVPAEHPGWAQVTPQLNSGRGCMIFLPSFLISLEESTDVPPSGPLYLQIEGLDEKRVLALKGRYSVRHVQGGLYGDDYYAIKLPDGSLVRAVTK